MYAHESSTFFVNSIKKIEIIAGYIFLHQNCFFQFNINIKVSFLRLETENKFFQFGSRGHLPNVAQLTI